MRPQPRLRDYLWLLFAVFVLVGVFYRDPALLFFAVPAYWLVMGAWRRTVWGCPHLHDPEAPVERRCQRHRAVSASSP